jgi:hypothetical protein
MGAVIEWTPPAAREIAALSALLEPWRRITAPVFHGVERLPAGGPVLFVGNHTVYGMLDMPLMILELQRHGFWVRGLADRLHYAIPGWRELLTRFGAVPGTRENLRRRRKSGHGTGAISGGPVRRRAYRCNLADLPRARADSVAPAGAVVLRLRRADRHLSVGGQPDEAASRDVRDLARFAVKRLIEGLVEERRLDPRRGFTARVANTLRWPQLRA